jgi:CheY-like chemotaxis protein
MPANETRTILIVESDILLRHVLAESLRGCGFEVIEATSAIEARTMIQKGPAVHILLPTRVWRGRREVSPWRNGRGGTGRK